MSLLVPLVPALLSLLDGDPWLRYLLLFATLALHEFAHAGACLALRGERAIVRLWPFFGRAEVAVAAGPRRALTALAAPIANLLLAGALAAMGARLTLSLGRASLPDLLLSANLLMGVGNLLPLAPLDGGRALREFRGSPRS